MAPAARVAPAPARQLAPRAFHGVTHALDRYPIPRKSYIEHRDKDGGNCLCPRYRVTLVVDGDVPRTRMTMQKVHSHARVQEGVFDPRPTRGQAADAAHNRHSWTYDMLWHKMSGL